MSSVHVIHSSQHSESNMIYAIVGLLHQSSQMVLTHCFNKVAYLLDVLFVNLK